MEKPSDKDLQERINRAKEDTVSTEEYEKRRNRRDDLIRSFLLGEIDNATFFNNLENFNETGVIRCDNLGQFIRVLRLLKCPPGMYRDILAHENAHMLEAQSNELDGKYCITFYKNPDGIMSMRASVAVEWSIQQLIDKDGKEVIERISSAPENLSDSDKQQLAEESE